VRHSGNAGHRGRARGIHGFTVKCSGRLANELDPQTITDEIAFPSAMNSLRMQVPLFNFAQAFTVDCRIASIEP
jgi:hypothetical protein